MQKIELIEPAHDYQILRVNEVKENIWVFKINIWN